MDRAGKVATSSPRAMVTSPCSSGWRRASMMSRENNGNSSRKSTPCRARLISPGCTRPVPPPSRLALVAEWCGARNGGRAPGRTVGDASPDSEWMALSSRDCSTERSGSRPGRRSASVVLPAPLGPLSIRWCPPAAATSRAKRASAMPCTSTRSRSTDRSWPRQLSTDPVARGSTGGASGTSVPPRSATAWRRERTPNTSTPGTIPASSTWISGTTTRRSPWARAAITIGSTPRTGRSRPSRVSSPISTTPSRSSRRTLSSAASTERAIARSRCGPRLGRSAGESRIVTRRVVGQSKPLLTIAVRQRSRPSLTEASGRPTTVVETSPWVTSAWTSTTWPLTPSSTTVRAVAQVTQPTPRTCSTLAAPPWSSSTPTRSSRTSSTRTPCSRIQRAASRRSRATLTALTDSSGVP